MPAPSLTVVGHTGGRAEASWSAITGATSYDLAYWGPGSTEWVVIMHQKNQTSYSDTNLAPGQQHWYSVRANGKGDVRSPWSSLVSVTLPSNPTPADTATPSPTATSGESTPTPTPSPTATSGESTPTPTPAVPIPGVVGNITSHINYKAKTISLLWDNPNPPAHRYQVLYRRMDKPEEWTDLTKNKVYTHRILVHKDISYGKTYRYSIRGFNSDNVAGSWTTEHEVVVVAPKVLPAINSFQVRPNCDEIVWSLCWPYLWPWREVWMAWFSPIANPDLNRSTFYQVKITQMKSTGVSQPYEDVIATPHVSGNDWGWHYQHAPVTPRGDLPI